MRSREQNTCLQPGTILLELGIGFGANFHGVPPPASEDTCTVNDLTAVTLRPDNE